MKITMIEYPTEQDWLAVKGYEGLYEVSAYGDVRRTAGWSGRLATGILRQDNVKGYKQVSLYKNGIRKRYKVHRIVAEAFIPNPEKRPQVNHIDGNKWNNFAENLEWCTQSENMLHAKRTGLSPKTTEKMDKARSKVGKETQNILNHNPRKPVVARMNGIEKTFDSVRSCARHFGVSPTQITYCCKNGSELKKIEARFSYAD